MSKKVLLLGSGRVSAPVCEILGSQSNIDLTIGTMDIEGATRLLQQSNLVESVELVGLEVRSPSQLNSVVQGKDLIISLLPPPMHPIIAESCITNGIDMLTTSYVSPELDAMNKRALSAGITMLNETGLDPGLDHLCAMEIIDNIKRSGGSVQSFVSYCGGLPAPPYSHEPLRYKFSWSPKGVLSAGLNGARFRRNGDVQVLPDGKIFSHAQPLQECFGVDFSPTLGDELDLEGYPNRNALTYADIYGIKDAHTVIRGTIRYKGFCSIMNTFKDLGLFSRDYMVPNWPAVLKELTKGRGPLDAKTAVAEWCNNFGVNINTADVVNTLEWLGMFDEQTKAADAPIIDNFCHLLENKLKYKDTEQDMILLGHEFISRRKTDGSVQKDTAVLVKVGEPGGKSAMELTVGVPCAIAATLMLDGTIASGLGVIRPVAKTIYKPMLEKLKDHGIEFQTDSVTV